MAGPRSVSLPRRLSSSKSKPPDQEKNRLSIIAEDESVPPLPRIPPRTHAQHRPVNRRWHFGDPPRPSFEKPPPVYSLSDPDPQTPPRSQRWSIVRNNRHVARRGGWKRLLILAIVVIIIAVGLALGLAIGLKARNHNNRCVQGDVGAIDLPKANRNRTSLLDSSALGSNSTSKISNETFPAGSYSLPTFLDSVSTNCTSDPSTWSCYPYVTYNSTPSAVPTTYDWNITGSNGNYTISSSDNPFFPDFADALLKLQDAGSANERYTFQVVFNQSITPQGTAMKCLYSNTQFEASLYTKTPKSYPSNSSDPSSAASSSSTAMPEIAQSDDFQPWPFAVEVRQLAAGGLNVPQCSLNGNSVSDNLKPQTNADMCSCVWKNWDP
ncbi:hypothetical protein MMC20_003960 [Loxospora ochrophaea]|nr:hypothetical protein [Loxospora ochrophaea]